MSWGCYECCSLHVTIHYCVSRCNPSHILWGIDHNSIFAFPCHDTVFPIWFYLLTWTNLSMVVYFLIYENHLNSPLGHNAGHSDSFSRPLDGVLIYYLYVSCFSKFPIITIEINAGLVLYNLVTSMPGNVLFEFLKATNLLLTVKSKSE